MSLRWMLCVLVAVLYAGVLSAQASPEIRNEDAERARTHDRPAGRAVVRIPGLNGAGSPLPAPPNNPVPPSEGDDIPPVETPANPPPPLDPPTFFGEPTYGKFVFALDASGSMGGQRIATLRTEAAAVINQLSESDELDVCSFGTQLPAPYKAVWLWEQLQPATEENKAAAIEWINGPSTNPGGGNSDYECLKRCVELYPSDLTKLFYWGDGDPGYIQSQGIPLLQELPGWWGKFEDCTLVGICIGNRPQGEQWVQALVASVGGVFITA
jgi:hypothetical protein